MKLDIYKCNLVKEATFQYKKASSDTDVYEICKTIGMTDAAEEYFYMFALDNWGSISGIHEISHGTVCGSLVSPRDVYKRALVNNAVRIIVAHNHPSGCLNPSNEDIAITNRLYETGLILDVKLVDHLIVSREGYFSFYGEGILGNKIKCA